MTICEPQSDPCVLLSLWLQAESGPNPQGQGVASSSSAPRDVDEALLLTPEGSCRDPFIVPLADANLVTAQQSESAGAVRPLSHP